MKRLAFLFFILASTTFGQGSSSYQPQLLSFNGAPTGTCAIYQQAVNINSGAFYVCNMNGNATIGAWLASGGVPITTVSGLNSVSGKVKGTIAAVTDGTSASDCTMGGGSTAALCIYSGSVWASSGGGSVSVTTKNSGLSGSNVIYPNAPPYNISFDGKVCIGFGLSWANTSTTVTCTSGSPTGVGSAVLTSNSVTITWTSALPFNPQSAGWKVGDSATIAVYSGADTFFNGTFPLTAVTSNSVSYAVTHANGTSTTLGQVNDNAVGPFLSTDTGKSGFGTNCSTGVLACVAATAIRPLGAVTYISQTQLTVAGNSTAACLTGGCQFWWFTDDRAKWGPGTVAGTVDNALQQAQGCVAIINPAGVSPIPFGLFNSSNPTCGQTTSATGNLLSNTDIGNVVLGQGMGNTIFLLPPDTDFTKCTLPGPSSTNICLWGGISGGGNFTIHGGGNGIPAGGPHNGDVVWGPNQNASFFDNISLTEFGSGDTGNSFGAVFEFANKFEGIYVDQFMAFPCYLNGQNVILSYYSCGDSRQIPITIGGSGTVAHTNNGYVQATNGTIGVDVGAAGTNVTWYSSQDQSYGAVGGGGTHIYVEPGSVAHVEQWSNLSGALRGFQLGNTAKLFLRDSTATGSTNAIGTNSVAMTTGGFFNQGGNVLTGGVESTLQPTWPTVTGATATAACAVAGTCFNETGTLRMTVTAAGTAAGTVTMNFAGTFTGPTGALPTCQFSPANTGTGAWNARATAFLSTRSSTAPVITWDNNAAALGNLTWDIDYTCTPR